METPRTTALVVAGLVVTFLAALVAANLIIAAHGPSAAPYVALGLVALDLVTRDVLHDRVTPRARGPVIAGLIVAGAVLTLILAPGAARIAGASAAAFAAAMIVDTAVYHASRHHAWLERTNRSNVASAIVDTAVFFTVAGFGLGGPAFIQAGMKIAGGLLFALALERLVLDNRDTRSVTVTVHGIDVVDELDRAHF